MGRPQVAFRDIWHLVGHCRITNSVAKIRVQISTVRPPSIECGNTGLVPTLLGFSGAVDLSVCLVVTNPGPTEFIWSEPHQHLHHRASISCHDSASIAHFTLVCLLLLDTLLSSVEKLNWIWGVEIKCSSHECFLWGFTRHTKLCESIKYLTADGSYFYGGKWIWWAMLRFTAVKWKKVLQVKKMLTLFFLTVFSAVTDVSLPFLTQFHYFILASWSRRLPKYPPYL
jgi:hypothetical protein